jgi:hypothetical protein
MLRCIEKRELVALASAPAPAKQVAGEAAQAEGGKGVRAGGDVELHESRQLIGKLQSSLVELEAREREREREREGERERERERERGRAQEMADRELTKATLLEAADLAETLKECELRCVCVCVCV